MENIVDQSSLAAARQASDVENKLSVVHRLGLGGEEGCDELAEGVRLCDSASEVASTVACRAHESAGADVDGL